MNKSINKNIQ